MEYPGPVVSAAWLAQRLDDPSIRIIDNDTQIYDGSWEEWGRRPDLPIEVTVDLAGDSS